MRRCIHIPVSSGGARIDPAGGSFVVTYDTDTRPWRYTDEIGRKMAVLFDGCARTDNDRCRTS